MPSSRCAAPGLWRKDGKLDAEGGARFGGRSLRSADHTGLLVGAIRRTWETLILFAVYFEGSDRTTVMRVRSRGSERGAIHVKEKSCDGNDSCEDHCGD